jgi:hypothetical protein
METTRRIEQYLEGSLSLQDKIMLEEEAAHNPELRELIRLHAEVNESIRDEDFFAFHNLVAEVGREYLQTETGSVKKTPVRSLWHNKVARYAAILIVVLGTGMGLKYLLSAPVSVDKLYSQYYSPYDADAVTRSASDKNSLDHAIISYSNADYSGALSELNNITAKNPQDFMAWFYRGLSCLEVHQAAEAVRSFRMIPSSWDSPYKEYLDWYLAMALLQNSDRSEAKNMLEQIKNHNGYYAGKAGEILNKLNR